MEGREWRVEHRVMAVKAAGALTCAALTAYLAARADWPGVLLAVPATVVLAALALRDMVAPVRLATGPDGLTVVAGFAGRRHIPWPRVEEIRVDARRRFGLRTELLEIDTGEHLHLFSAYDLGASCPEVAAELRALRPG